MKNYRIKSCKLKFNSATGQVQGSWSEPVKTTDKEVSLYFNEDTVPVDTVTVSGNSYDFTDDIRRCGEGSYYIEVYPSRLGSEYSRQSTRLVITQQKLKKAENFDSGLYAFTDSSWNTGEDRVTAQWSKGEKSSKARVALYKGTSLADKWYSTDAASYEFTSLIARKGSGTYTFRVYPSVIGDSYTVESVELYVDAAWYKKIKARAAEDARIEESQRRGWYRPEGTNTWKYYKAPGEMARKEWLTIGGSTYYFSSSGVMQIGWQAIDEKWYFFDETGALVKNTSTSDGRRLGENGEWLDENGVPVSSKGQKQAPSAPVILTKCTVSVSESGKEPGQIKSVVFNGGTGFSISGITYSVPAENWKAGEGVRVTFKASASANYAFSSTVTFTARNCSSVSSEGDSLERTVTFVYYPKKQLVTPTFFYVHADENTLNWRPVDGAASYRVAVYEGGTQAASFTTKKASVDLGEISADEGPVGLTVKVTAYAADSRRKYLLTSQTAVVSDMDELREKNSLTGTLTWRNGKPKYLDENGEKVRGWKCLAGRWMHFNERSYADGPGWFKDTDGLWYYFDSDFTMCTGMINDGKADYFMNDGSIEGLPLGAYRE